MRLTTTHLRIALGVVGLLGLGVLAALLWGGVLPAALSSTQRGIVLTAAAVAAVAPLLGAVLPVTRIERPSSAVLPALGLFGFGVLFTDALNVFPVRIIVILGGLLALAAVVAALFGGPERAEAAEAPERTTHRFH